MPTNREVYFSLINKKDKYLTRLVVKSLLEDANGFSSPMDLYKYFDMECLHYDDLMVKVNRVISGEPFQYVIGYANFIDRFFKVTPDVLIPRQETEQLVINVKGMIEGGFKKDAPIVIADIGTGSGAIAISLKRYFPNAIVYGVDIDEKCLAVARENSANLGQKVEFLQGNMLEPLIQNNIKVDVLVSNPPYIEKIAEIDEQVYKYEPHKALLASPCTKFYEEVFKRANEVLKDDGVMAFEIGEDMEEALTDLVYKYFPTCNILFSKDIYNKTRFLYIIDKGEIQL